MGIITDSGRAAIAEAVKAQPLYLAWGSGGEHWGDERVPEDEGTTALANEVGRKALFRSLFVYPDDAGELSVSEDARYAISTVPTKYLYAEFQFDFSDGAWEKIREVGIFMGGRMVDSLPPGQSYFTPAEVADPGTLLMLQHRETVLERPKSERCLMAFVLAF